MKPYRSRWPSEDRDPAAPLPRWHVVDPDTGAPGFRRLAVTEQRTVHLVPLESILWISAKAGRLSIHRTAGELEADGSLSTLTRELGSGFQRINRNIAVNMAAVREIRRRGRRGESAVILHDGRELPVTRLYSPALRAWLAGTSTNERFALRSPQDARTRTLGGTP